MPLGTLFTSIRDRRRRAAQQSYEEGAQIMRRLQELLAVPAPPQEVAVPFANASIENNPAALEARLNMGFSACIGETKNRLH